MLNGVDSSGQAMAKQTSYVEFLAAEDATRIESPLVVSFDCASLE